MTNKQNEEIVMTKLMQIELLQSPKNGDLEVELTLNADVEKYIQPKHTGLIQSVLLQITKEIIESAKADLGVSNESK